MAGGLKLPGRLEEDKVMDDQPLPRCDPPLPRPVAKTDRRTEVGCFAGSFDLVGEGFLVDPEIRVKMCNFAA